MNRFADKVVAVTGGASGIGEATVRHFAEEGARVAFADRDAEQGRRVAGEVGAQGAVAHFVEADMGKESDATGFVEAAVERFGRLDVLVNNAGIRKYQAVTEASKESWDEMLAVNLLSYALCARTAIPVMAAGGGGAIVNVASIRSLVAGPECVQYDTTKAAVLGLTRSMARDHAAQGVRVNAVGPGPIFTPFHEKRAETLGQTREAYVAEFGAETMMKRPGTAREVANGIAFLASDDASYITGACLFIDGGRRRCEAAGRPGRPPAHRAAEHRGPRISPASTRFVFAGRHPSESSRTRGRTLARFSGAPARPPERGPRATMSVSSSIFR